MVPGVKNLTAAVQIAVEVQVRFPAELGGLKGPALPQVWLGFNPWPGIFLMPRVPPKKKNKPRSSYCHPFFFFFFLAAPSACGSSRAKNRTLTIAVT